MSHRAPPPPSQLDIAYFDRRKKETKIIISHFLRGGGKGREKGEGKRKLASESVPYKRMELL